MIFSKKTNTSYEYDHKKKYYWKTLLKASFLFIFLTLGLFFLINFKSVKSHFIEWKKSEEKSELEDYFKDQDSDGLPDWWEREYNLNIETDDSMEDPDGDYANNLVEYIFDINPNNPDTDNDGYFDGEEILEGYNPDGIGRFDLDKDNIYDWWEKKFGLKDDNESDALLDPDKDGLTNLEEFFYQTDPFNDDTNRNGIKDGIEIRNKGGIIDKNKLNLSQNEDDSDNDQLSYFYEVIYGTNPQNNDSDKDGRSDYQEIIQGNDPTGEGEVEGRLVIPSIEVDAPIIWTQDEKKDIINEDLEDGIIHYPGTAFPGMKGNTYLTGHSSYYFWSDSDYKEVLKDLDKLKAGDSIKVLLTFKNGNKIENKYTVTTSKVVFPVDPVLFRDYEGYELTLVTCWPIGTNKKRLMVKANLIEPLP